MSYNTISLRPANTIPANRIVRLSAANTCDYGVTATNFPIGVSLDTVLDTTCALPIQIDGIARIYFNDSVAAGALVTTNTLGMAVPFSAAGLTGTAYAVGILLGAKVNATGTIAEVLLRTITR